MTKFVRYPYAEFVPLLALLMLLGAPPARAEANDAADFRFQGFVSQRLTASSGNNNFFGETADRLSADYTELGLGASWRPRPQWLLAGQAIYRRGGESEDGRIEPDYYYVAYTPWESEEGHITAKLGKIKVPYGLYNDMRDTPMTRPGILAPQSLYLDALRQLNQAAGGVHLEAERIFGDNSATLRFSQIKPNVRSDNTYWAFLGDRAVYPGELYSRDNEAFSGQLAYDHDGGRLRAWISHAQGLAYYRPAAGDSWITGDLDFKFTALSLQWNGENFSLTGERARNRFLTKLVNTNPALTGSNLDVGYSWYLQGQWRFAPRWEALLRYDAIFIDQNDKDGARFAANNPGRAAWSRYAKDWTVGVRYRLDRQWLLAGELHHVDGTNWLPPADNLSNGQWLSPNTDRKWNLLLLQATYQF
ncbi:MAG: hypothetical protein Q7W53_06315 [Pseudomonadota bacterium]|nr:hypothetical protein [Pseudomonadota bacterium]